MDNPFEHRIPSPESVKKMVQIRDAALVLHRLIADIDTGAPERYQAQARLAEAVMWANKGIVYTQ